MTSSIKYIPRIQPANFFKSEKEFAEKMKQFQEEMTSSIKYIPRIQPANFFKSEKEFAEKMKQFQEEMTSSKVNS
jgi:hypothetical protein